MWSRSQSYAGSVSFLVPCGQCIGCRLSKAQDWATRLTHEASLHEDSVFITLTYADGNLPLDGSVSVRETQLFLKRLRKHAAVPLRYFTCGEYGEKLGRPHYHAIIYGFGFPDRRLWRVTPRGHNVWRSELLEAVWPYGQSEIGSLTPESAGYVARYCLKKVTGRNAGEAYRRPHPVTGEVFQVLPEFARMSRRPGIGAGWFDLYSRDCFPSDYLVLNGSKVAVPQYYRRKLEGLAKVRLLQDSKARARDGAADATPERLAVREESKHLRIKSLTRNLEVTDDL